MIKAVYKILIFPINVYNYIINWALLNLTNTNYQQIPIFSGIIIRRGSGRLCIGKKCKITSDIKKNPVGLTSKCLFYIAPTAVIDIGNNVGISNSLLYAIQSIKVEDDVMIGGGCQILDNDFHSISYIDRIINGDNNIQSAAIVIKKGAFIGTSSIILKGVTIGERSIIAAGSVVSKDIPQDEIWGGNPAKFIRRL